MTIVVISYGFTCIEKSMENYVSSNFYNACALNSNYGNSINVKFNCLIDTNASNCDGASSCNCLVYCNSNIRHNVYHNMCLNSNFHQLVF